MTELPTIEPSEIIELHTELISRLAATPEGSQGFSGVDKVIGFKLKDPDVVMKMTLSGENSNIVGVGENEALDANISVTMPWEVAHKFWSGKLDLMGQLLMGKVKVEGGDMDPLFRLKGLVPKAREVYAEIMKERYS
ncbi:MAG TPA: SCP2 sterol-binding domain-containing protein [bacterium]